MTKGAVWRWLSYLVLLALGALALLVLRGGWVTASNPLASPGTPIVVIDAGHGGEDGGAVARDGTVESTINLAVAQRLDGLLSLCGCRTEPLRTEDRSLHSPEARTLREKKVSDIHNRVDRVRALEEPRLISIHQNHFSEAKYHGAQVFYAGGPLGQPWAELTQGNLARCLDPENGRQAKPIDRAVYLMDHVACPAILVECGFLSNPEETARLKSESYQLQLALVIGGSYLQAREAGLM